MGKEQDLLQAVKDQDAGSVEKLLVKHHGSKSNQILLILTDHLTQVRNMCDYADVTKIGVNFDQTSASNYLQLPVLSCALESVQLWVVVETGAPDVSVRAL